MMYSKSLKFSIVLRLVLCNRPTSESRRTVSVYEVSMVFRQKERGAIFLYKVNLFLSPDKFKTLKGKTLLWKLFKEGIREKNRWEGEHTSVKERYPLFWKKQKQKKNSHDRQMTSEQNDLMKQSVNRTTGNM